MVESNIQSIDYNGIIALLKLHFSQIKLKITLEDTNRFSNFCNLFLFSYLLQLNLCKVSFLIRILKNKSSSLRKLLQKGIIKKFNGKRPIQHIFNQICQNKFQICNTNIITSTSKIFLINQGLMLGMKIEGRFKKHLKITSEQEKQGNYRKSGR